MKKYDGRTIGSSFEAASLFILLPADFPVSSRFSNGARNSADDRALHIPKEGCA